MKKYELTEETKTLPCGTVLHRIRAVREFPTATGVLITPGILGGWVEKEENLSHENKAWVADDACVYGDARIYGDAEVYGDARIYGDARVSGYARIYGDARVSGEAEVFGNAIIRMNAHIITPTDYITAGPAGSRTFITTYCIGANLVFCGCFSGTLEQFSAAVEKNHAANPKYLAQYRAMIAYFAALRQNCAEVLQSPD